jgi:hypothetical protein
MLTTSPDMQCRSLAIRRSQRGGQAQKGASRGSHCGGGRWHVVALHGARGAPIASIYVLDLTVPLVLCGGWCVGWRGLTEQGIT